MAERIDRNFLQNAIFSVHCTLTAVPAWFVINLLIYPTFSDDHPGYSWFVAHGSQEMWAFRFLLLTIIGTIGLISQNRWTRLGSAAWLAVGHAFIATAIALSSASSFGVGTYSILPAWLYGGFGLKNEKSAAGAT